MKKNNLILVAILAVGLIILAGILIKRELSENTNKTLRDFAVSDTATINKIFLVNMNKDHVLLERSDSGWIINGQYKARKDLINILLETVKRIEIKSPVTEKKLPKVMRDMASMGTKIEIYQKNKLVKTYYVGSDDSNNLSTYMIMEGSNRPFAIHLPGFTGFLSIRYSTEIGEWRERIVFKYDLKDIKKVKIIYPSDMQNSFIIEKNDGKYNLKTIIGENVDFIPDTIKMKEMFNLIKYIGFEAFLNPKIHQQKLDSLKTQPILCQYEVTNHKGQTKMLKTYTRPNISKAMNDDGEFYEYDIDFLYGIIEDDLQVVLLQYYVIDPITRKLSEFKINFDKIKK